MIGHEGGRPSAVSELRVPDVGRELVVVDVEGNGTQPPEIVEIAALRLPPGGQVSPRDVRSWLVRPSRPISRLVTGKVHGITNDDVAAAPAWREVADQVAAELGTRPLVAHSASVERDVLATHLPAWRPELVLDTLRLARAVLPSVTGGHGLDNLITSLPLAVPLPPHAVVDDASPGRAGRDERARRAVVGAWRRHRAAYDVWMTAALWVVLVTGTGPDLARVASLAALRPPYRAEGVGPTEADAGAGQREGLW